MSIHQFKANLSNGEEISLEKYKGEVVVIVNTATKCGLAPQYEGLQKIHTTYGEKGVSVLGFPCNQFMNQEPGTDEEIAQTCALSHSVTFPLFQKIDVNGEHAHPLYKYLQSKAPGFLGSKAIKWNFTKFLIDQKGEIVKRYSPTTKPEEMIKDIEKLLA